MPRTVSPVILLGESDPYVLGFLARLCEASGRVVAVRSVEAARRFLAANRVSLLVSGRTFTAGGEALALADELKKRWPFARAILITSNRSPRVLADAAGAGFDAVLGKPFDIDELDRALARLLAPEPP